jgi:hypothetical protein
MEPITPDTKVGALLEAYPALEETLVGLAPEFAKLRNPILRRTVAKVATLAQAARIAGLDPRALVLALRRAAGLPDGDLVQQPAGDAVPGPGPREDRQDWIDATRVRVVIDADAMLARGEHPLGAVRAAIATLAPGDLLRLDSSFRPVPLLDALAEDGYATAVRTEAGRVTSYVRGR